MEQFRSQMRDRADHRSSFLEKEVPTWQSVRAVTWHLADAFQEHEFSYIRTMVRRCTFPIW